MLIFTGADGNYALQAQVLMHSLVKTQHQKVRLMVFGNNWKARDVSKMYSLQNDLVSVEFITVDPSNFAQIRLMNDFPLATAYNIIAPLHSFENESRILYLDADTLVTKDLSDLWNSELSSSVGAVIDAHIVWMASPSMWRPWREEQIEPLTPYLNTGMMLIDLNAWRSQEISERTLFFLNKYDLPCADQDALNLVLRGNFDQIHPRFNSMPYHHFTHLRYLDTVESDYLIGEAITNPAIIHYHRSFFNKPWNYGCSHPGSEIWRQFASEVRPHWRKKLHLMGLARSFAANQANMTALDSRTYVYPPQIVKERCADQQ
jgi:lipopolysaccharide biosynthesis glycosyltransferase